jgi:hypothetical protein
MHYCHCVEHNAVKIGDDWAYVDDLLTTLKALNQPSFQMCCPKCSAIKRRDEIFRERSKNGYYEKKETKWEDEKEKERTECQPLRGTS